MCVKYVDIFYCTHSAWGGNKKPTKSLFFFFGSLLYARYLITKTTHPLMFGLK